VASAVAVLVEVALVVAASAALAVRMLLLFSARRILFRWSLTPTVWLAAVPPPPAVTSAGSSAAKDGKDDDKKEEQPQSEADKALDALLASTVIVALPKGQADSVRLSVANIKPGYAAPTLRCSVFRSSASLSTHACSLLPRDPL
jgi:hypothetical protein